MPIEKPFAVLPLPLGNITTGNARTNRPASHLALPQYPGMVWRSNGNGSLWARGQFAGGSVQAINFASLMGTNAQASTVMRLRLGTTQAQVDGTAPYDSGDQLVTEAKARNDANRVPYSRYEDNWGWSYAGDVAGSVTTVPVNDRVFIRALPVFTAANQNGFLSTSWRFPASPFERLSVSALIETFPVSGPPPSFWQIFVQFANASGVVFDATSVASGSGSVSVANGRYSNFIVVPAGTVSMLLGLQIISAGAGSGRMTIADPMVALAPAPQSTHPAYVPGPNANDGVRHSHLELPSTVDASWWRIDINAHSGDFQASSLILGTKRTPGRFYNRDRELGYEDFGALEISRNGVIAETPGVVLKTMLFRLGWVSEEEFYSTWAPLFSAKGKRQCLFWCFDPDVNVRRQDKTFLGFMGRDLFMRGGTAPTQNEVDVQFRSIL